MVYSLVGEPFKKWVMDRIKQRNEKQVVLNNMMIQLDPDVAAAFRGSNAVSSKYFFVNLYLGYHYS